MPVVNLPAQRTHIIPLGQAQFLLTLAAALAGPILLLTLALSLTRNYKTSSRTITTTTIITITKRAISTTPTTTKGGSQQPREFGTWRTMMPTRRQSASNLRFEQHDGEDTSSKHEQALHSLSPSGGQQENFHQAQSQEDEEEEEAPPQHFETFLDRRPSVPESNNDDFDPHRFNSDYSSSTPNTQTPSSPPLPLRQSHTQPNPLDASVSESATYVFTPSSFPSSSQILPLAPDMDMNMDIDNSDLWKRHTRVYGGGVCLACMASGGSDEGGFYGENVPLDQRRYITHTT